MNRLVAIVAILFAGVFVVPLLPGQTSGDADARGDSGALQPGRPGQPGDLDPAVIEAQVLEGTEPWLGLLVRAGEEAGVPWQVLAALLNIESGGDPHALSPSGAVGLMQVMPGHWQELANQFGADLWDPWTNIRTAAEIVAGARGNWATWDRVAAAYFGALDEQGNVTAAADAFGTTGFQYVERFLANLAKVGFGPLMTADFLALTNDSMSREAVAALAYALDTQGAAYVWAGESFDEGGFDCSGLMFWAYGRAGIWLPRTAHEQWEATRAIDESELLPGDLIFFSGTTEDPGVTHVAMYAGAGLMLNAPKLNDVVRLVPLNNPFWREHLTGFGRVN
jgi:cell wall-associated NlpC family hydrolase